MADTFCQVSAMCGHGISVTHRGKSWSTFHVCGRRTRHTGRHECRKADCRYRWPKQRRRTIRRQASKGGTR